MRNLHQTAKTRHYFLLTMIHKAWLFFIQLRPKQWSKNTLVFAAVLFSFKIASGEMVYRSLLCFLLFCLVSSVVYILNDFVDLEADRLHPEKKHRPMASGALNPYATLMMGFMILVISLYCSYLLDSWLCLLLTCYFIINIAYSLKLKHIVIFDVMIVASGFVFRAIAGGLVIQVPFTPWFLICTMFLALFLAISKRRHELYFLEDVNVTHRKVLHHYSPELLNQLNSIITTAAILSYALFTFTSGHSMYLMWTVPFVIYGIFRYLYLIHVKGLGGSPEKVLIEDKHILVTVIVFVLMVAFILKYLD